MILATAEMADRRAVEDSDDDLDHIVCCDDDLTLCGLYIPGDEFIDVDVDGPETCEVRGNKERLGQPCAAWDCPKRGRDS